MGAADRILCTCTPGQNYQKVSRLRYKVKDEMTECRRSSCLTARCIFEFTVLTLPFGIFGSDIALVVHLNSFRSDFSLCVPYSPAVPLAGTRLGESSPKTPDVLGPRRGSAATEDLSEVVYPLPAFTFGVERPQKWEATFASRF